MSWLLTYALTGLITSASLAQTRPAELSRATPSEVGMSADKLDEVKSIAQAAVDRHETAGVVVLVARHGQVVRLEAFGKMDVDTGKAMRPDAIFRIQSMTKPITTVAGLLLVEQGKIKLDDPVSKYLPELAGLRVYAGEGQTVEARREMTVRDLMRHTAGLTYGMPYIRDLVRQAGQLNGGMPYATPVDQMYIDNKLYDGTSADMIRKLGKLPLQDQPGTRFNYSVASDVLGRLIEVVSGKPLDEFLRERIFRPLDMRDTGYVVPDDSLNRFTASHRPDGKGGLKVFDAPATSHRTRPRFLSGSGGLVSTARDYLRFCQMLLAGGELQGTRLLRGETVREMTTNQLSAEALPITFGGFPVPGHGIGLGLMVRLDTNPPAPAFGTGEYSWSGGASTFFWVAPKPEVIVIILQQVEPINIGLLRTIKPVIYSAITD